jgi:integrase
MGRAEVYIAERSHLTRDGRPRKGWSTGTAWTARVPLPDGGYRQFYAATKAEVERKVGHWRLAGGDQAEVRRGGRFQPRIVKRSNEEMAGAALLAWATAEERRGEWDVRRQSDVAQLIQRHVVEPWATLPLNEVTSGEVTTLLSRLDDRATTRENLRRALRLYFRDWAENPVSSASRRTRRAEEQRDDGDRYRVLSETEWVSFVAACEASSDPLAACLLVILETGIRSEEARALQYWDFDEKTARLQIRRVVVRGEKPYRLEVVELAKTKYSRREIPLSAVSRQVLSSLRWPEPESYHELDDGHGNTMWAPDPPDLPPSPKLIWCTKAGHGGSGAGRPLDQARLSKTLEKVRAQAGIPRLACRDGHLDILSESGRCRICGRRVLPLRVHDLRHTHCSYLVAKGVPLPTVRARMGWSPKSNTIFRYAHDTPAASQQTVEVLDALADVKDRIAALNAREENEDLPF